MQGPIFLSVTRFSGASVCRTSFALLLALLTVTPFLWTACDLFQDNSAGRLLSFENIEDARRLNVPETKTVVFRTEAQWRDFWNRRVVVSESGNTPPPPSVDFGTEMVIGLLWGQRSGCSSTVDAIQKIAKGTRGTVVQVDDWTEGSICQALVQPRQVIRTKKAVGPVKFEGNAVPRR